jgi:hypothetical protein
LADVLHQPEYSYEEQKADGTDLITEKEIKERKK